MSLKIGTNFAVFLLFFGVAALEAVRSKDIWNAAFWLLVGAVFLFGDNVERKVRVN